MESPFGHNERSNGLRDLKGLHMTKLQVCYLSHSILQHENSESCVGKEKIGKLRYTYIITFDRPRHGRSGSSMGEDLS